jgi:predicted transcriptional regulator
MQTLNTQNPEQLIYKDEYLTIEILGGIRLDRLDSLRVTLKMEYENTTYRHTLDLYNDVQVTKLIRRSAGKLQLGMGTITDSIEALTEELEQYRLEMREEQNGNKPKAVELTTEEIKQAEKLLKTKDLLNHTNNLIGKSGVIGEENNRLLMYIIFTSRKMANPLHIISMGASGTGKSHLQETVAKLIPEEDTLSVTDLSESSFYYFDTNELSHKLMLIEDLDGAESALYPLRELQSKKTITKTLVERKVSGQKTVHRTVHGPVCVAGCTTKEQIYEDNANRSFLIHIDQSTAQDQKIMQFQRQLSAGKINMLEQQQIRTLLKNSQRILKPLKVVNPYAELLELPSSVFKPRRTNAHYLHFIEAVTFYNQYQREVKVEKDTGVEYIITDIEDIENANKLLKDILIKKSDTLSPACRNYFEHLKMHLLGEKITTFTNKNMSFKLNKSLTSVKRYHQELYNKHFLKIKKKNKQKGFEYEIVSYEEYKQLKENISTILDQTLNKVLNQINKNKKI